MSEASAEKVETQAEVSTPLTFFDRGVLRVARAAAGLLGRLGVQRAPYLALLRTRLTLAHPSRLRREATRGQSVQNALSVFGSVLFGAMISTTLLLDDSSFVRMSLLLAGTMFVAGFGTIGLADLFLDTQEWDFVGAMPVSARTWVAVRVSAITAMLTGRVGASALVPAVVGSVMEGPWPFLPAYLLGVLLAAMSAIGIVLGLLLVGALVLPLAKLREALQLFQLVFSLIFFLIPQLGQLGWRAGIGNFLSPASPWCLLLPPTYGAGLYLWMQGRSDGQILWLAVAAVAVPVFVGTAVIRGLSHGILRLAHRRPVGDDSASASLPLPRSGSFARLLTRPGVERAGFLFFTRMARRDLAFRMRVGPSLLMPFVFLGISLVQRSSDVAWVTSFGLLTLVSITLVQNARFSPDAEARWLFHAVPLERPGRLCAGTWKAVLLFLALFLLLPMVAAVTVLGRGEPTTLLACSLASLASAAVYLRMIGRHLPFTQVPGDIDRKSLALGVFASIPVVTVVALTGYLGNEFRWFAHSMSGLSALVLLGAVLRYPGARAKLPPA